MACALHFDIEAFPQCSPDDIVPVIAFHLFYLCFFEFREEQSRKMAPNRREQKGFVSHKKFSQTIQNVTINGVNILILNPTGKTL
jgi:hypothetical protein